MFATTTGVVGTPAAGAAGVLPVKLRAMKAAPSPSRTARARNMRPRRFCMVVLPGEKLRCLLVPHGRAGAQRDARLQACEARQGGEAVRDGCRDHELRARTATLATRRGREGSR